MNDMNNQVNEILTANGLDFTIEKLPLVGMQTSSAVNEQGEIITDKSYVNSPYFGLMNSKSGEIINTVKAGYTVSQNAEIVELVLKGIAPFGDQISVQKAGSLNGGRRVFLQLAIEGNGKVGNDTIKRYVTIIDSNDGSTGLSVGVSNLTMSCSNQFFQFNKNAQSKIRHSRSLEQKVLEIPSLIKLALQQDLKVIERYQVFQSTSVSRSLAHQMVNSILGVDKTMSIKELSEMPTARTNSMDTLYDNIDIEMNSKGNSLWGLFSGVTRWTTHVKSAPKRENGRIESLMLGTNYNTNQKALDFCLNY
jgi:hypothetical protein